MTALKDRFWAKVAFKEFIRHFRKLSPEQIVSDVMASMDALEDLDDEGDSFGSKMVRWSMERVEQYPMAQANGQKGGRPRKSITADGDTREGSQGTRTAAAITRNEPLEHDPLDSPATISQDAANRKAADDSKAPTSCTHYDQGTDRRISTDEALELISAGVMAPSPAPTSKGPAAMPADVGEVYAFAAAEGLDSVDAYECWSVTVSRDGRTADGRKIRNWKAYVRRWCATRAKKRRTA